MRQLEEKIQSLNKNLQDLQASLNTGGGSSSGGSSSGGSSSGGSSSGGSSSGGSSSGGSSSGGSSSGGSSSGGSSSGGSSSGGSSSGGSSSGGRNPADAAQPEIKETIHSIQTKLDQLDNRTQASQQGSLYWKPSLI